MAKGLEFDEVIVPDADNRNYNSDYDRNLLYIACTRAMHKLTLLYTGSPSVFLPKQDAKIKGSFGETADITSEYLRKLL